MDIAAVSVALSQNNIQQQASLSVAKIAMGVDINAGDAIAALAGQPTQSIHPSMGAIVDIKA